jgi:2-polyprenyl-3-methyl-5-hydroxy-6-metoxy-1,4-benzoquinol methylase/tetratricopeptide (TPR) repeat protein
MGNTIGLCMIVKDEVQDIIRIYNDYTGCFDKLYITVTAKNNLVPILEVAKEINSREPGKCVISEFEWVKDFSKARNFNFKQADTDYIFWMDADDDLVNGEKLSELIRTNPNLDVFSMTYIYAKDEVGNPIMVHPRERLIKNNKKLEWKGRVHETLIPYNMNDITGKFVEDVQIVHRAGLDHNVDSMNRNIDIMLGELAENGDKTDPRTLSYLATGMVALHKFDEAIKFYEQHIARSGWLEDKYLSWCGIAQCLRSLFVRSADKKLLETAISADNEAVLLIPGSPDAYLGLGETYVHLKEWDKVIEWTTIGMTKKPNQAMPFIDPTRYTIRPYTSLAYAYLGLGQIDKAYSYMSKARDINPLASYVKEGFPFFEDVKRESDFFKNLCAISLYLEDKDKSILSKIENIIPKSLMSDDRFAQLAAKYRTPKNWPDKSVVIFCAGAYEEWADPSVDTGIGGSEEAVIYMSRELTKLGYSVTVYNEPGSMEGLHNGVTYLPWHTINTQDHFDTIIMWRGIPANFNANRRIVWLHDVPMEMFTNANFHWYDKVLVLSEYHKSLLPACVKQTKVVVTRNGINLDDIKGDVVRQPKRLIYTSSHDRGLEVLLDMWPEIRQEIPEAELHCFYGWNTYDKMVAMGMREPTFKQRMLVKMSQPGIVDHGRVNHKDLAIELSKSDIFAYPCTFEEISCISAMKAQACGAIPVVFNYAALVETVKHGVKVTPGGDYKTALIEALKADNEALRRDVMLGREYFGWDKVAKEWSETILVSKRNEYKSFAEYKEEYTSPLDWKLSTFDDDGKALIFPRYQFVLEQCKKFDVKSTLDAACHDGVLSFYLNSQLGIKADGFDIDIRCVESAKKTKERIKSTCEFFSSPVEEFNPEQKYDLVSCLECIEHVIDPKAVIAKLDSLVRDGGYVVISTPHRDGLYGEKNFNPQHINHYNEEQLAALVGKDRVIEMDVREHLINVIYKVTK